MSKIKSQKGSMRITLNDVFVYALFLFIVVGTSVVKPNFFSAANFMTIAKQTATTAVVAFGMTFVITSGNIDLSIAGTVAMTGMLAALVYNATSSVLLATLVGVGSGVLVGFINGILISKVKLVAFLATLGMGSICEGIAKTITDQKVVTLYEDGLANLWGRSEVFGVPSNILWMFLFFLIAIFIYHFTTFGNHVKAVGGNAKAARFSGVRNESIVIRVMTISGFFAGLCGILYLSRLNQGRPDVGTLTGSDAITSVVLGGTPFTGGKGSVITSLIGAFVIVTMTNAMVILGIPTTAQLIVKGIIIIIAVSLSMRDIVIFGGEKTIKL